MKYNMKAQPLTTKTLLGKLKRVLKNEGLTITGWFNLRAKEEISRAKSEKR